MTNYIKIVTLLLIVFCYGNSHALETKKLEATKFHLTTQNGLAQNDPQAILQDTYGFIWIATNDGLSKYDGYKVENYHIGDANLKSSLIISMVEDENSNLWIGTNGKGFSFYNRSNDTFFNYRALMKDGFDKNCPTFNSINTIVKDPEGNLWGYDKNNEKFFKATLDEDQIHIISFKEYVVDNKEKDFVRDIEFVDDDMFILNEVKLYKKNGDKFSEQIPDYKFAAIEALPSSKLCAATYSSLEIYNPQNKEIEKSLHLGFVVSYIEYSNGYIWMLSQSGFYRVSYDLDTNEFGELECIDQYKNGTIPKAFTIDNQGGMWCGLLHNGVIRYSENIRPFNSIEGLEKNCVLTLFKTDKNRLWVSALSGPEGSVLYELTNTSKNEKPNYKISNQFTSPNIINSITKSEFNNKYYFSTNSDGVYSYENNQLEKIIYNSSTMKVVAHGKHLWVATYGFGLWRYNIETKETTRFKRIANNIPSNIIRNMMIDSEGNLWVATAFGIVTIAKDQLDKEKPQIMRVLPRELQMHIIALKEAYDGSIWIGTLGNGLYRIHKEPNSKEYSLKQYSTADGLPNNAIKSIEQDEYGMMWISSNRGLSRLDTTDGSVLNYDVMDGTQDLEFSELSSLTLSDGTIFFGGVQGLNYFNVDEFKIDEHLSEPTLTDIQFFGHSVSKSNEYDQYVPSSVEMVKKLDLPYNVNSFTFEFTGINYTNPRKNNCQYKLEGFDEEWHTAEDRRAVYTNISPGQYKFRIRTSNSDGIWNENELNVIVNIAPPIWKTWYAYTIYVLLLIALVVFISRNYKVRLRRQNEHSLAKLERAKIADMLTMRTRFFTNISHEFRTPLTLILSSIQQLGEKSKTSIDTQNKKYLDVMEHNGNMLMRQVDDLLEFAKQDFTPSELNLKNINFNSFARKNFEQFKFWADQKGVNLEFNGLEEKLIIRCDTNILEHIIYNLCSNAIKHTPEGKGVTFNIERQDSTLRFAVIDSGLGMTEKVMSRIFERFYTKSDGVSHRFNGTGIGLPLTKEFIEKLGGTILVKSQENVGSTFIVTIPIVEPLSDGEVIEMEETIIEEVDEQKEETTPAPQKSKGKAEILVVDDNDQITTMLYDLLSPLYNVNTASDGLEALKVIKNSSPDILISDVMMPNMDGLQLCKAIKENNETSHIPVVLLTAKSTNDDMAAGYQVDADAYCHKPFNNKVLMEIISSILKNRARLATRFKEMDEPGEEEITSQEDMITANDKRLLERITTYVEDNLHNQELVVNDLCDYVGLASVTLNKKLKSLIGVTANAFIRSLRMKRAAALLRTGRYSISEITYDVGFVDLRYFRECFKKEYGMLPQEYKDSNREEQPTEE